MSTAVHAWTMTVTVAGIPTDCLAARTSHAVDQPVGTARIDLPLPLPAHVVAPCTVAVAATMDGAPLPHPLFAGWFRDAERNLAVDGSVATLACEGNNVVMTYPFDRDVVYAGGARAAPVSLPLGGTYLHLGTQTVAWYADPSPGGTTVDRTFAPAADSTFLWVAGRAHGTNSYDTATGDKVVKDHSKVLVRQGGVELGRANFPVLAEQWSSELDYADDANWSGFELFVACDPPIDAAGGPVTVRFVSGHKPGTSARDEYEVTAVTYQLAGKTSVRKILRGLYKRAGFAPGAYAVNEITDLGGATVYLGGNGKVDAGQVVMDEGDSPLAFATRVAALYGFAVFDCGDGIPRALPVRGVPAGPPAAAFVEGASCVAVRTRTDAAAVYNAVRVEGASGTDADRKRFAYLYETADGDVLPNPAIPDPPGVHKLQLSSTLLTSDGRCRQVGEIAEVNNSDQAFVEWESWPHAVAPGRTVRVTAPALGLDDLLFLTAVRHDLTPDGFRGSFAGWKGVATPFSELPDPDPSEDDAPPTARRPASEWQPFRPLSAVNP